MASASGSIVVLTCIAAIPIHLPNSKSDLCLKNRRRRLPRRIDPPYSENGIKSTIIIKTKYSTWIKKGGEVRKTHDVVRGDCIWKKPCKLIPATKGVTQHCTPAFTAATTRPEQKQSRAFTSTHSQCKSIIQRKKVFKTRKRCQRPDLTHRNASAVYDRHANQILRADFATTRCSRIVRSSHRGNPRPPSDQSDPTPQALPPCHTCLLWLRSASFDFEAFFGAGLFILSALRLSMVLREKRIPVFFFFLIELGFTAARQSIFGSRLFITLLYDLTEEIEFRLACFALATSSPECRRLFASLCARQSALADSGRGATSSSS